MRFFRLFWLSAACALLSSCHRYWPDVEQGNVLTESTVAALKPGMTREAVTRLLGASVLDSARPATRVVYVYWFESPGKAPVHRKLVLTFDGDHLKTIEASSAI